MLFELGCDTFCSHGPLGRSHIARQGARSTGPQVRGYSTQDVRPIGKGSAPEDREERQKQTQDNAQNDAGHDGKIERRMFALDPNVAGQSAQPFWRETAPHHQAD